MFPLVFTAVVVIGLLIWSLAFRLESGSGDYDFSPLINFAIVGFRLAIGLIIWLGGMLIWSLWFR